MQARFENFTMLACYFPQRLTKIPFFIRCIEIAAEHDVTPFLLVGDLNTGNQMADKDVLGALYSCSAAFDDLGTQQGLHDLWRHSNGLDAREWTWLSPRQNGFRIDHAFGNAAFMEWTNPVCRYDHAPRELCYTDHSATILRFSARQSPAPKALFETS